VEETTAKDREDRGARGGRSGSGGGSEGRGEGRWRWLESTVALQREAYGFEWTGREPVSSVTDSLKGNLLAAIIELGEVSREFSWKYWAHDAPYVNRESMIGEIVDVGHFIANMLIAVGCTDEEWEEAYQEKQLINRERQKRGYSAKKGQ